MVISLLKKVFGTRNDREVKRIQVIVDQINLLESSINKLSDDKLRSKTGEFKSRLKEGATIDDILPEAFALVREAVSPASSFFCWAAFWLQFPNSLLYCFNGP